MLAVFFAALLSLATLAVAQSPASSVFVYNGGFTGSNFTFAINLASDSQDLFFHLNGPSQFSWIAVGTGRVMKDSLMFIAYTSSDGNNVTLSPRVASDNVEPTYNSSLDVSLLPGTTRSNNSFVVNAKCTNCRSWSGGSLNLTSRAQDFIYAVGPKEVDLKSNDKAVGLQQHVYYGVFSMDLVQATGTGGLPNNTLNNSGAVAVGGVSTDSNWALVTHMALMIAAFVFLFPVGYLLLRYFDSVKYHWWMQTVAIAVAMTGGAIGIYESLLFNNTKNFGTAHQIVGIVVSAFLLPQWVLGYVHHKQYPQKRRRTWITQSHRILGPLVIISAIGNGAAGFKLAEASSKSYIAYGAVVWGIAMIIAVMVLLKMRQKKKAENYGKLGSQYSQNLHQNSGEDVYHSDIPLTQRTSPPVY